ncbi:hypothetical protein C7402_105162 [Paraburkholderia unamae]|uniref:Uncharacterized protein n=1 Tax=Paraburkholderia unamae TaxID=219649 RepID=A0ABX5KV99_9BURK|nr:hypothetical protein C7402_105162 [Paraburkholderia unamae]
MRAAHDNALLGFALRPSRARRALECVAWMAAYGGAIAALWYGALQIGAMR